MKRCPSCERTYTDDALSFCPNDGTPLVTDTPPASFDPQATIMASPPKVNAPSGPFDQPGSGGMEWPSQSPAQQSDWSNQPPAQQSGWGGTPGGYQPGQMGQQAGWQAPPPPPYPGAAAQQKTLAIVSLVLGILSFFCFGILSGPIAIVLGLMAMSKIKSEPNVYGGKGLALGGIITGALGFFLSIIWLIVVMSGSLR